MSDTDFSPWGRPVWLTIRKAAACSAEPWYGNFAPSELKWLKVRRGWWPFFSVDTPLVHFYIGWKPIKVPRWLPGGGIADGDPKFYWWPKADLAPGELAVQWSHRWGFGAKR